MAMIEELFGQGANYIGNKKYQERLQGLADDAAENTALFSERAREDTAFQPFTVTSGLGTSTTDEQGNINYGLSPQQQQTQDSLLGQSNSFFNQAAGSTAQRESDVYDRIRATQRPGEERDALSLENRLLGQGRLGISTNAYGGTPEQLAQSMAQSEARNSASLSAIQQAQAEQMQQSNLGREFQLAGYNPENQALNRFQPAMQISDLFGTGQREGANLGIQADLGGLAASQNYEQLIGDIMRAQYSSGGNLLGQIGQGLDSRFGSTAPNGNPSWVGGF